MVEKDRKSCGFTANLYRLKGFEPDVALIFDKKREGRKTKKAERRDARSSSKVSNERNEPEKLEATEVEPV